LERKAELLVADFDKNTGLLCARIGESLDAQTKIVTDLPSVLSAVHHEQLGVVVLDAITIIEYLDVIKTIRKETAKAEILILDEVATIPKAVGAIKAGAVDYLEKPLDEPSLEKIISEALTHSRNFQPSVLPLEQLERQAIETALAQANGDKIEAARLLSIGKTTLYRKLREYHAHQKATLAQRSTGGPSS
jgi:DNA-binding NtrC family response regulator